MVFTKALKMRTKILNKIKLMNYKYTSYLKKTIQFEDEYQCKSFWYRLCHSRPCVILPYTHCNDASKLEYILGKLNALIMLCKLSTDIIIISKEDANLLFNEGDI